MRDWVWTAWKGEGFPIAVASVAFMIMSLLLDLPRELQDHVLSFLPPSWHALAAAQAACRGMQWAVHLYCRQALRHSGCPLTTGAPLEQLMVQRTHTAFDVQAGLRDGARGLTCRKLHQKSFNNPTQHCVGFIFDYDSRGRPQVRLECIGVLRSLPICTCLYCPALLSCATIKGGSTSSSAGPQIRVSHKSTRSGLLRWRLVLTGGNGSSFLMRKKGPHVCLLLLAWTCAFSPACYAVLAGMNSAMEVGVVGEHQRNQSKALHKCLPCPQDGTRGIGFFSSVTGELSLFFCTPFGKVVRSIHMCSCLGCCVPGLCVCVCVCVKSCSPSQANDEI